MQLESTPIKHLRIPELSIMKLLDPDVWDKYKKNLERSTCINIALDSSRSLITPSMAFDYSFSWYETPEGFNFWRQQKRILETRQEGDY